MTPQQEGLLGKARRNIRSAKVLLSDGDCDTAVSRAYFAMFYVAEALLLSKALAYSKHSAVIAAFGKEFAKPGILPAEFHAHFREAAEARNISDYQRAIYGCGEAHASLRPRPHSGPGCPAGRCRFHY